MGKFKKMDETLKCIVAKEILSKVLSFAADDEEEIMSLLSSKEEFIRLRETAEMVQDLLFDVTTNRKTKLKSVRIWVKKLNDVAYDADAVLEEFNYQTLRLKLEINPKMEDSLLFRLKIASINKSLHEIYLQGTRIGLKRLQGIKDAPIEHTEIQLTQPFKVKKMDETPLCSSAKEIISKLLSYAAGEGSPLGVKEELKHLHEAAERVQDLLFDVSVNKETQLNVSVRTWLKKLNDVAYAADAKLVEFNYQTLERELGSKNTIMRLLVSPIPLRVKMSVMIRSIIKSLNEIYKQGTQIGLNRLQGIKDATVEHTAIRLTYPYVGDLEVWGREAEVSKMVDELCFSENEKHLSFMAIVGKGGLGKTTLAQLVCKHDMVVMHFDEIIWITVSEDFDVTRILNDMMQSLTGKNPRLSNVEEIVKNELGGRLKGKRYLLVLDDVWNEDGDKWDCLRKALLGIDGSRGSKIMVTTRIQYFIKIVPYLKFFHLKVLSLDESLSMFKQRAFAEGGPTETKNMVDIGRDIVIKCGGLPLVIKALGGLMYSKKSEIEWQQMKIRWPRHLDRPNDVLKVLKICYEHLRSPLKRCFAFCSIFHKDFDLEKSNLIQLWMALGLLHPPKNSDLSMENMGNKYFGILLFNSMLQDAKKDEYGFITSCKMHDLFHDLAQNESNNYCSNLEASNLNGDSNVVHLSLISSLREIPEISTKICLRLQTLILKGGLDGKLLASFKWLRVLGLENYSITELPDSIEMLKYLRYLDISKTSIFILPNNITKLYNLQTLKLRWVHDVLENFGHLINLRHFCFGSIVESQYCMLIGVGRLSNLQTLPFFTVNRDRGCHIEELGSLDNLNGDLTIFGLEHVENYSEAKYANLSKKSHLCALRFCWATPRLAMQFRNVERISNKVCNDEDVLEGLEPHSNLRGLTIENFAGGKFPSWMMVESQPSSVLSNLVKIRLCNCNGCEQIPPLGHLQYLKVVKIIGMGNVKVIGAEFYGKHAAGGAGAAEVTMFPALRELTLKQMPSLEKWSEAVQQSNSMSVFPCLEKLKIKMCSSLKTMPSHLPSLRELIISGCTGFSYFPINLKASIFDLSISGCPNLSCLPNKLEALVKLHLEDCNNLTDIPCLPSISEVSISGCTELIGLSNLTQVFPLRDMNFILEIMVS
ncbi:hypothetical protein LguiB_012451 [Lonicera macranthoides]